MSQQLDAKTAHGRLRRALAALRLAEGNAVTLFAEILQRHLFHELGFATIHLYASEALGFSRSKTYEFIRLAEALDRLPRLKAGIESGEVSWTKAREVVKVATPKSEEHWLEIAAKRSRRELEKQVVASRGVRDRASRNQASHDRSGAQGELLAQPCAVRTLPPAAAPVSMLTLRFDTMQRARFDAMIEKLMKRFHCGREDALLMAMEAMLIGGKDSAQVRREKSTQAGSATPVQVDDEKSTRVDGAAPYQVLIYRCDKCTASAVGPERKPLGVAEAEQVECDSKVLAPGTRNKQSIPPARRRAVMLRDEHRCRVKGCSRGSFLEVHHLKARSLGGSNREENLITLCSSCHRHLHDQGGRAAPLREA